MAKKKTRSQIVVGISIVNGVPRVRPLSAKEEKHFYKTHPNVELPTFSLKEIERGLEELEKQFGTMLPPSPFAENPLTDPATISILGDPSAK